MDETICFDGHEIELSNLDKVLFPEAGITKAALIDYYRRIGPTALRYYRDRPLSMHRYPDGIESEGFFQKNTPDYFPDWIARIQLSKQDGKVEYPVANNAATLVYLANQACITPHLALAKTDHPHHPDRLIFDLDPSDDDFSKVQAVAGQLHDLLQELGLPVFVQTTGSSGLHLLVPLDRGEEFDTVRDFSDRVTRYLASRHTDLMTVAKRKDQRGDRVYLDVQRNAYGQTAVAPYAVRAREGAPVATPLRWSEVQDRKLHPQKYHVGNLFRRLAQIDDPWADLARHGCSLQKAGKRLCRLNNQ